MSVVSYDFDGVLSFGPPWVLRDFLADVGDPTVDVWICTARYGRGRERAEVEGWLRLQGVDVPVVYTDRELKGPHLHAMRARRHYDDDPAQLNSADEWGVDAIFVET